MFCSLLSLRVLSLCGGAQLGPECGHLLAQLAQPRLFRV